jgi:hypothetical protein
MVRGLGVVAFTRAGYPVRSPDSALGLVGRPFWCEALVGSGSAATASSKGRDKSTAAVVTVPAIEAEGELVGIVVEPTSYSAAATRTPPE